MRWRRIMLQILALLASATVLVLLALYVGLQIRPAPFPTFSQQSQKMDTVPLPQGLPAPVERFYRKIYGESIPVITSAVLGSR